MDILLGMHFDFERPLKRSPKLRKCLVKNIIEVHAVKQFVMLMVGLVDDGGVESSLDGCPALSRYQ